ncbi:MAG: hypothetical protein ACP5SH_00575 [Syntrophobacteraceae bacterium]
MAMTAQEVFATTVHALPPNERLRLAAMILQELSQSSVILDCSETWSDEDKRDLTSVALRYASELYPEEQDLV